MNKSNLVILLAAFSFLVLSVSNVSAIVASCDLNVKLLNQDPYPAVPGEYVKVVFQLTGIENPDCGTVDFQLVPEYPISIDPTVSPVVRINSGTFVSGYSPAAQIPFKVRISQDAIDGENPIKIRYSTNAQATNGSSFVTQIFNVTVNNTETDFDVIINSYSPATKSLTLGLINVGKSNAAALTLTIPEQDGVNITGGNQKIIGSLSSNDDTTVNFDASVATQDVKVILAYNDLNGVRRTVEKTIRFSSNVISTNATTAAPKGASYYLLILTWVVLVIYFVWRLIARRRKRN
jgi:hypothetical protein